MDGFTAVVDQRSEARRLHAAGDGCIAQEALATVVRHRRATKVMLTLTSEQSRCAFTVEDNGQGFDPATAQGKGVGLRSMQECFRAVGGTLVVASALDKGTGVTACCSAFRLEEEAEERRAGRSK